MRPDIHAPDALEPAMDMLENFIKTRAQNGAKFDPGETIQCGWMWFMVEEAAGARVIAAP